LIDLGFRALKSDLDTKHSIFELIS
jgi:hypothetical protein